MTGRAAESASVGVVSGRAVKSSPGRGGRVVGEVRSLQAGGGGEHGRYSADGVSRRIGSGGGDGGVMSGVAPRGEGQNVSFVVFLAYLCKDPRDCSYEHNGLQLKSFTPMTFSFVFIFSF